MGKKDKSSKKHKKVEAEDVVEAAPAPQSPQQQKEQNEESQDDEDYDFSQLPVDVKQPAKKAKTSKSSSGEDGIDSDDDQEDKKPKEKTSKKKSKKEKKPKKSQWSIWVGNLSFSTTTADLKEFFKTDKGEITRINMPKGKFGGKPNKGFAYVDFDSEEAMDYAVGLSEQELGGRSLLIKKANDFVKNGYIPPSAPESASKKSGASAQAKSQPSPTLFLGNLPFHITKNDVRKLFDPFGKILKVRLATFEDNKEKCKGFGYVDFKDLEDSVDAFNNKEAHAWNGKSIRVEYAGELATKKGRPWEHFPVPEHIAQKKASQRKRKYPTSHGEDSAVDGGEESSKFAKTLESADIRQDRALETDNMAETKLQGLPVSFKGQKTTFD